MKKSQLRKLIKDIIREQKDNQPIPKLSSLVPPNVDAPAIEDLPDDRDPGPGPGPVDEPPGPTEGCTDDTPGNHPNINLNCADGSPFINMGDCDGFGPNDGQNGYLAINYDPSAIVDKGCIYQEVDDYVPNKELGCKNPNDINYCEECGADTVPTSCAGIRVTDGPKPGKIGCTDNGNKENSLYPGYAACNYDSTAEVACDPTTPNNDCCDYEACMGCMVSSAQNYDPEATIPCPDNECCGGRREDPIDLSPTKCEWGRACNAGELCPEGEEYEDHPYTGYAPSSCCDWSCYEPGGGGSPNSGTFGPELYYVLYAQGPCTSVFGFDGYNGYNFNQNGCCSGGDCQAPSGCVIDQLGGDIGAALMETDLVSTVCQGIGTTLQINSFAQTLQNTVSQWMSHTETGINYAQAIGLIDSDTAAAQLANNLGEGSQQLEEWGEAVDITNYEIVSESGVINIGATDILDFCNATSNGDIIEFMASASGVGVVPYAIFYNVICGMENFVFGSGGVFQNDEFSPCCGDAYWSVLCGSGGGLSALSFYAGVFGWDPNWLTPARILEGAQTSGLIVQSTATGPYGELGAPDHFGGYPLEAYGTGYCNNGYAPTHITSTTIVDAMASGGWGNIDEGKVPEKPLISEGVKARFQKIAGIKKKK